VAAPELADLIRAALFAFVQAIEGFKSEEAANEG
jgi:hypothetical protein